LETPEILLVPLYEIRIHAIHIRYRFTVAIVVLAGRIEHFAIRHDVPANTPQFIGLPGGNDFQVNQLAIRLLNQILQPAGSMFIYPVMTSRLQYHVTYLRSLDSDLLTRKAVRICSIVPARSATGSRLASFSMRLYVVRTARPAMVIALKARQATNLHTKTPKLVGHPKQAHVLTFTKSVVSLAVLACPKISYLKKVFNFAPAVQARQNATSVLPAIFRTLLQELRCFWLCNGAIVSLKDSAHKKGFFSSAQNDLLLPWIPQKESEPPPNGCKPRGESNQ
jgi:hypothetical protein